MGGKTRPCLACEHDVPNPLTVCPRCEGAPLLGVPGAGWAVEAGPVSAMAFRKDAVELLAGRLEGLDRAAADGLLRDGRVRVVDGIQRPVAEALAAALGHRETKAQAVQGPASKLGLGGALKGGTPLVLLGGGALLGFLVAPIGTTLGLAAGAGAGVVMGAINTQRSIPVLGKAPMAPVLPHQVDKVPGQLFELRPKLSKEQADRLAAVVEIGFRIIGRLTDSDDLLSVGITGLDDGMGKEAVVFVLEAVEAAERIARDSEESAAEQVQALRRAEEKAQAAQGELDDLEERVGKAVRS